MSQYTTDLANLLCGGSSRKLIAGWWYCILVISLILTLLTPWVMSSTSHGAGEGFTSVWSAFLLIGLSIGGTMIMRKFHNSLAVGFFMGCVVTMSQFFFLLSLVYSGYAYDQRQVGNPSKSERLMAFLTLVQAILLGSFAAILGAHRSEILDHSGSGSASGSGSGSGGASHLDVAGGSGGGGHISSSGSSGRKQSYNAPGRVS